MYEQRCINQQLQNSMESHLSLMLLLFLLTISNPQSCPFERCCNISPCVQAYCTQRTSETWISSQSYSLYQYTKLVLANGQCMPCPYNCKRCTTPDTCTQCYNGYYSHNNQCLLCSYKCKRCTVTNSIQKCQQCLTGTYLDDTSFSCKSCPMGAKSCSSSTAIIQCQTGYKKSSNSLFCTPCPNNCLQCPTNDAFCQLCATGYYKTTLGQCQPCAKPNCINCYKTATEVCVACLQGYMVVGGNCVACPVNCRLCRSVSICMQCQTGYYLQSGGCVVVGAVIQNCYMYASGSVCSVCDPGYYYNQGSNRCIPCSITCQTCTGTHFGTCQSCTQQANLFNQMCIIDPFPSSLTTRKYYTLPSSLPLFSGGSISCFNTLYTSPQISIILNNLSAYKISLSYKLYTDMPSQQYSISLNTNSHVLTSTGISYEMCDNNYYYIDIRRDVGFVEVALENLLVFRSGGGGGQLHLAEIVLMAYKCSQLCVECSQVKCFTCLNNNLYTQDAYCVYVCSQGYYTYQTTKQCVKQCPQQTYLALNIAQCLACISPCHNCLTQQYCLSCIAGFYLTPENTCAQECPYRYYGDLQTQQCQRCVGRCLECTDTESCVSCKQGFLEGVGCVDQCGIGFQDLVTLRCQPCSQPCLTCQLTSAYCLTCLPNYFFHNNTCLQSCPSAYFPNPNNICQQCSYPCQTCTSPLITDCLSCIDKYLLPLSTSPNTTLHGQCVTVCPNGYYQDNIALSCLTCNNKCTVCYESANNCYQCVTGYYLFQNQCVVECPEQYYQSGVLCEMCGGYCYDCVNITYCVSCGSNFLQDGQCVRSSQCYDGFYADIVTLRCQPCSLQCSTCQISPTKCLSCSDPTLYLFNYQCLSQCPSPYFYPDQLTSLCKQCQPPCITCLNQTHCLSCQSGYKYSPTNNICSSTCAINTYFNLNINDCQQCSTNCMLCQNQQFCYMCNDAYYLYVSQVQVQSNLCVRQCPDGYYANMLACERCLFPCGTCVSTIQCLSCMNGILYQGRCLAGCPDSTYRAGDVCLACQGNCLTCYNTGTQCLSCLAGFYLLSQDCVSACPSGTYAFSAIQKCELCPSSCSQCLNSTYCTACIVSQTYLTPENKCTQQCPSGLYGNPTSLICQACQPKCQTCLLSPSNCQSCSSNYLLISLPNSQFDCLQTCPSLYYQQSGLCYQCIFPCKQCLNTVQCKTCIDGMFYHQDSTGCLLHCPLGTFYSYSSSNNNINQCRNCQHPCKTCTNQTYCVSCQPQLLLHDGKCVQTCPEQYYQDGTSICNRCYGLCKTCSGKYHCLTCHSGYSYDGFCYSSCPPGTYADFNTKKCQPCVSPCLQCQGTASYCKKCQFSMFAYKGTCQNSCPTGTYQSSQLCLSCSFPCINCPDQFTCNQCIGGYLLYMRTSCIQNVQQCPNDLYKMNSKQCVPVTWCPDTYFKDVTAKTCTSICPRQKYVNLDDKKCLDRCQPDQYVSENMICRKWVVQAPKSLMTMQALSFIKSSYMHIVITFNQTESWLENSQQLYMVTNLDISRRMLATTTATTTSLSYKQLSENQFMFAIVDLPLQCQIRLPAHYVVSNVTKYNLQDPYLQITLPAFTAYLYSEVYTGSLIGQFSQGLSWFIIIFTLLFCFVNRVSDVYILWDNAQLLYLLIFLNLQYPPNLNQFLLGMSNTHFLFIPQIFTTLIPTTRNISYPPFYAYTYDSNFLRTAGSAILLILIILSIFIILKITQLLITRVHKIADSLKQYPKFKQFVFKGLLRYRWHHTSDVIFMTYDIIMLFAIAQLIHIGGNSGNVVSNVFAIIFLIIYVLFPFFIAFKLYKHYTNISKGRLVKNLQCFYRGIDKTNKFGVSLILLRYFRKLMYCAIISIFSMQPMFALPILMFMSVVMALFLFINKPFRKRLSNVVNVLTEVCLVIFFLIVAVLEFSKSDREIRFILGWLACGFLVVMLFVLIFQVFCKTLFFLQPQQAQAAGQKQEKLLDLDDKQLKAKYSEEYLRKKAGEFFYHIFPKLRTQLGMDQSDDQEGTYQDGDSQNSENNDIRQKKWGFDDQQSSRKSDEFRHYSGSNSSQSAQPTRAINQDSKTNPPAYLIRCVKQL